MTSSTPILLALTTAASMAGGQILFKLGADELKGDNAISLAIGFLKNPHLMVAIVLYAFTILLWIYVLKFLPLSIAYPLTACSYVLVPALSYFILKESLTMQTLVGSVMIIAGIATIHMQLPV